MRITRDNYEEYVLEYIEGELSPDIHRSFEHFLVENPDIGRELSGLNETILDSDVSFKYPEKDRLYKRGKSGGVYFLFRSYRVVAASVLFLLGVGLFFWMKNENIQKSGDNSVIVGSDQIVVEAGDDKMKGHEEGSDTVDVANHYEKNKKTSRSVSPVTEINGSRRNTIENANDIVMEKKENFIDEKPDLKIDIDRMVTEDPREEIAVNRIAGNSTHLSMLPAHEYKVMNSTEIVLSEKAGKRTEEKIEKTYRIRIPEELLSETWTDLSFNNFKRKLVPEYFTTAKQ